MVFCEIWKRIARAPGRSSRLLLLPHLASASVWGFGRVCAGAFSAVVCIFCGVDSPRFAGGGQGLLGGSLLWPFVIWPTYHPDKPAHDADHYNKEDDYGWTRLLVVTVLFRHSFCSFCARGFVAERLCTISTSAVLYHF